LTDLFKNDSTNNSSNGELISNVKEKVSSHFLTDANIKKFESLNINEDVFNNLLDAADKLSDDLLLSE
jgi:hypothetical protein